MSDGSIPDLFTQAGNLLKELSNPSTTFKGCVRGSADVVPYVAPDGLRDRLGNLALNPPGKWTTKQLASVVSLATAAPVGKGTDTVVDHSVRRAKEIAAGKVVIRNEAAWKSCLDGQILPQVARGLWPDRPGARVVAEFYKMTLYEPGDFFKPHRDTMRDDRHFGTLVVVLPSSGPSGGGDLVVGDADGEEVRVQAPTGTGAVPWVAFFANVLHEVKPVTHGVRVALLYHLHRIPTPHQSTARRAPARALPPLAACLKQIASKIAAGEGDDVDEVDDELFDQSSSPLFAGFLLTRAYGGALVAGKLQGPDKLLYEAVAPHFKGARLASVDVRVHGPGGGDDERCTPAARYMSGIIAEIDEVDVQKAPKRKADGGSFSKATYPARPLSTVCLRHFDCATDVMDCGVISSVHWLAPPALPTNEYGHCHGGQTVEGGVLNQVLKLKALEKRVRGTGNEGSEAYFLYRHAALLVPLKKNAERGLDSFSHRHAQRHHPDYNP